MTVGKEYRIQVSAVNAEGISEPLGGVDSFITENPFGTPGAPGKPEMVGVDSDHFDMKWTPPKNNGGSPITGYQLEARLWKDNAYFREVSNKKDDFQTLKLLKYLVIALFL